LVSDESQKGALEAALGFLSECLQAEQGHVQAFAYQAGIRWLLGRQEELITQARTMNQADVADPCYHYLAGVCHLAARDATGMLQACQRAAALAEKMPADKARNGEASKGVNLMREIAYVAGLGYLLQEDSASATRMLRETAKGSVSTAHAQALLGKIAFDRRAFGEAVQWWQALDAEKRAAWEFSDALAGTVFLAAMEAFEGGRYEQAAEKIREAGRLGWRDRRLGSLLILSLVKAGQELIYR
jgi:hypothetical protein